MRQHIKAGDANLGDVVELALDSDNPFTSSVVTQVTEKEIRLFRPYATTADFTYTGGVIPYIGIEQYSVPLDTDLILLQKGGPKK